MNSHVLVTENVVIYMPQIKHLHLKLLAITYLCHCGQVPLGPFRYNAMLNPRKVWKTASIELVFISPILRRSHCVSFRTFLMGVL